MLLGLVSDPREATAYDPLPQEGAEGWGKAWWAQERGNPGRLPRGSDICEGPKSWVRGGEAGRADTQLEPDGKSVAGRGNSTYRCREAGLVEGAECRPNVSPGRSVGCEAGGAVEWTRKCTMSLVRGERGWLDFIPRALL